MKKADQYDRAAKFVAYILKYHDRELQTIEDQIEFEQKSLAEDLKRIRERALPGAVDYGKDRIQGGSTDPDRQMIGIMTAIERRQTTADRVIERLTRRREQITEVRTTILDMEGQDRDVLLTLYYPYRTYDQAAAEMGIDRSTVARRRAVAFKNLITLVIKNKKIFS